MRHRMATAEYRLVVPGKPESFRTHRSGAYRRKVQCIAQQLFVEPLAGEVEVIMDHFHTRNRRMDTDNTAKCILDALTRSAYSDDRQVAVQRWNDHDMRRTVRISGPVDLVKPLAEYDEYVIVRIRNKTEA